MNKPGLELIKIQNKLLRRQESNLCPPGYEPGNLPTDILRDETPYIKGANINKYLPGNDITNIMLFC